MRSNALCEKDVCFSYKWYIEGEHGTYRYLYPFYFISNFFIYMRLDCLDIHFLIKRPKIQFNILVKHTEGPICGHGHKLYVKLVNGRLYGYVYADMLPLNLPEFLKRSNRKVVDRLLKGNTLWFQQNLNYKSLEVSK